MVSTTSAFSGFEGILIGIAIVVGIILVLKFGNDIIVGSGKALGLGCIVGGFLAVVGGIIVGLIMMVDGVTTDATGLSIGGAVLAGICGIALYTIGKEMRKQ